MQISRRKFYWEHVFIGSHHLIFETATRWKEIMKWERSKRSTSCTWSGSWGGRTAKPRGLVAWKKKWPRFRFGKYHVLQLHRFKLIRISSLLILVISVFSFYFIVMYYCRVEIGRKNELQSVTTGHVFAHVETKSEFPTPWCLVIDSVYFHVCSFCINLILFREHWVWLMRNAQRPHHLPHSVQLRPRIDHLLDVK